MTHSQDCTQLVKRFEDEPGYRAGACSTTTAYRCPAGVWTIGWGHTAEVGPGMTCTPEQADRLLEADLKAVASELSAIVPPSVTLRQDQVDALCSLCFNLGGGPAALPHKAPHLWADLLAGKIPEAADEFLDMDHALVNGHSVELAGLKLRRQTESLLFLGNQDWRKVL